MIHLDKLHHAVYSFALAVAGAFLLGPIGGIVVATAVGIGKELWDGLPPRNRFDWWDMAANALGLVAAWVVIV